MISYWVVYQPMRKAKAMSPVGSRARAMSRTRNHLGTGMSLVAARRGFLLLRIPFSCRSEVSMGKRPRVVTISIWMPLMSAGGSIWFGCIYPRSVCTAMMPFWSAGKVCLRVSFQVTSISKG